jgi:hypothetical protein
MAPEGSARYIRFIWQTSLMITMFAFSGASFAQESSANSAPWISNVNSVLYNGYVYVTGYVHDADDNPTGWTVIFGGAFSGSATVGSDGMFWFRTSFSYPYGEASVTTSDPHGAAAKPVYFEFQE